MTIKEVEEQTGLARSNVRFYEKEKLIEPSRNDSNGYREYSEKDVADIRKIAYLRTLGISIEDIRSIISGQIELHEVIEKQHEALEGQITDLSRAKILCEQMLHEETISYEYLQPEYYVNELNDYWKKNKPVFKLDSVSFLYLWGSTVTWIIITAICLLLGSLLYKKLPSQIPIQWDGEIVTSEINKLFIFAYPVACLIIRFFLRPCIYAKLYIGNHYEEIIAEYLTNYLCFVVLSVEVFTVLFIYGIAKSVVTLLFLDTAVFIGLLCVGLVKRDLRDKKMI